MANWVGCGVGVLSVCFYSGTAMYVEECESLESNGLISELRII